ncbi:hypothetical protein [Brevibacillus sp. HB1.1]|uniref:hypothetical protein n=1 Tax=Brevibacillus sp. HB1.1 TaxID=2738808 RepID=UPI000382D82A|nr:hypothetical protein [Brevibacillus sp. HB1.1]
MKMQQTIASVNPFVVRRQKYYWGLFIMLEVELDIFSGRPNPKWILSETEEKELLKIITSDPTQISPVYTPEEEFGLGYRGFIVREIKTDEGIWSRTNRELESPLPMEFRVGSKPAKQALATEWLLQTSEKKNSKVTDNLREEAASGVVLLPSPTEVVDPTIDTSSEVSESMVCASMYYNNNVTAFNEPHQIANNNCYAFASNHLGGGRWAHPGLRGGRPARENTCSEVMGGLYADGWSHHCSPSSLNVLMIGCVIKPGGPLDSDFHFYRLVTDGSHGALWGHKPGATPAKNRDDCGRLIGLGYDPRTICRGRYTEFCGFFYHNGPVVFVKSY